MGNEDSPRSHLFIGSSAEGEIVAKAVQYALRGVAEGQVWTQGVFAQTESFLHSLMSEVGKADFAVLVMTPDDLIESRGKTNWVPRDNVIFELGLFLSKLGPERTFVLFQEGRGPLKLPSDLLGITFSPIRQASMADMQREVGLASFPIEQRIRILGPRSDNPSGEVLITRDRLISDATFRLRWSDIERRCSQDLLIAGWSCSNVISPRTRDLYIRLCASGRTVRFLVLHPDVFTDNPFEMGPICNIKTEHVALDARKAVDLIETVRTLLGKEAQARFEVRGTKWFMSWSAVGVDMAHPDGVVQVEFYHYANPYGIPVHLDKRVNLILERRSSLYQGFAASIEAMWASATPL